jgi:hypothetical protein
MSARSEAKERRAKTGHGAEQARRRSRILEHLFGLHTRSRRVVSEHRHRRKLRDREVSDRSRRGLDWTNFFLADVQLSFGSFLAFYLADLGWSKQNVGLALTVGGLAAVAAQIPGGALADAVRWKRALAACRQCGDGGFHGCARRLCLEPCHIHCYRDLMRSSPGDACRDPSKRDRLRACAQCCQARQHL